MLSRLMLALAVAAAAATGAFAHEYKLGNLEIVHPHARATPPNAPVSAGYMVIKNTGAEADRLVAGSAAFAGKVEIHEMSMDGGVMQMRPLEGGLEIPAGGEVELKPGGFHVMFMQLGEQLKEGDSVKGKLLFEKAGEIEVEFKVEKIEGKGGDHMHQHGGSKEQGMNHMHGDDAAQIAAMMKDHFEREGSPLSVEPVVMSGEWAVAGWIQDGRGGRGLMKKAADGWYIHMCGGEGFKSAANLVQTGMSEADAKAIEAELAKAEAALGAEKIAMFDSFEGVVEVGPGGHHGAGHGEKGHGAHGHGAAHGG